jgi:hypothetical protein
MLLRDFFVRESNIADDLLLSGFLRPDRQLRRFLLDSSSPQAPRRRHLRSQSLRRWSVECFPTRLKHILDGLLLVSTIPNDIMERYGHFPFPDLGCKLTSYATFIFMSCTRYSVVILALDRYIAVGYVSLKTFMILICAQVADFRSQIQNKKICKCSVQHCLGFRDCEQFLLSCLSNNIGRYWRVRLGHFGSHTRQVRLHSYFKFLFANYVVFHIQNLSITKFYKQL